MEKYETNRPKNTISLFKPIDNNPDVANKHLRGKEVFYNGQYGLSEFFTMAEASSSLPTST